MSNSKSDLVPVPVVDVSHPIDENLSSNDSVLPGSSLKTEVHGDQQNEESSREVVGLPLKAQNLQGLFKLVSNLPTSNSNPDSQSLNPEKAAFLHEALESMAVDVNAWLKQQIDVLVKASASVDVEVTSSCVEALKELLEHVDDMDMATAFYKYGGLNAIIPLLGHQSPCVPWLAADVIANCCSNHPYCQDLTCSETVFTTLMEMARSKEIDMKKFKALSALSAMTRGYEIGINKFLQLNGAAMLCEVIGCGDESIVKKICFLIQELSGLSPEFKLQLVNAGIVKTLMELVRESGSDVENYLLTLDHIVTDCEAAANELLKPQLAFSKYYSEVVKKSCQNKEYEEVERMLKQIKEKLPGTTTSEFSD